MSVYVGLNESYAAGNIAKCFQIIQTNREAIFTDAAGYTLAAAVNMAAGEVDQALELLQAAVRLDDSSALTWFNLGLVLGQAGRIAESADKLAQACRLDPLSAVIQSALADSLNQLGRFDEAIAHYDMAIELEAGNIRQHAARASVLHGLGRAEEALAGYIEALELDPCAAPVWLNLGVLLQEEGHLEEALGCYDSALLHQPHSTDGWSNRGKALRALGRLEEAISSFDEALFERAGDATLLLDRGMCRLAIGDHAGGWADYEARLDGVGSAAIASGPWPLWRGEDLDGCRILVSSEQGYGDTFQFVRYIPMLAARGAEVTLKLLPEMLGVLDCLKPLCRLVSDTSEADGFDYQVPLMSLPTRFATNHETIPAETPYLCADAGRIARWAEAVGEGLKVGIAWQGNPTFPDDSKRSIPLQMYERLAEVDGVRLISLQQRNGLDQLARLNRPETVDVLDGCVDAEGAFVDTAAILANVDLIVTSDSAVAHLAGALGRPVWLALSQVPDWRWGMSGEECPWYPTMRIFRQDETGWDGLFDRMLAELHDRFGGRQTAAHRLAKAA
jgi:tetratricopeptide (TPR) repeat protein